VGSLVGEGPVTLWARPVDAVPADEHQAYWWPVGAPRDRLVVPAAAAAQVDALPAGDLADEGHPVTFLPADSVEVLDLVGRRRVRIRRAQCGLGPCACDLQYWPADRDGPVPDPEWCDDLALYGDPAEAEGSGCPCGCVAAGEVLSGGDAG
jgi:hypothetical protein